MQDESSLKQSRQARRKKLKLLDINSDEAIGDTGLPDEEKLEQLLPAEIGLLYYNKLFIWSVP